jgi:phenylacetate-CoA ligase
LDDYGNEVAVGELGHVVLTRLDGYSMPLIRYRLGDLAIKEDESKECKCGRPFPMIKKIIGRDTDVVRSPTGNALIIHFFTAIFEHFSEIKQFQVYQKEQTNFTIYYITDLDEHMILPILFSIKDIMNKNAGELLSVNFCKTLKIDPSPSGKPQIIISDMKK